MSVAEGKPYELSLSENDYAAWSGPPRRSVVICTLPRSGSTLLGEALYFAGGLGCPLEYFHAGFRPRFEECWQADTLDALRAALWRNRTDPSGTLSIKLMWRDVQELSVEIDPCRYAPLVELPPDQIAVQVYAEALVMLSRLLPNPTFIHLFRRDRIRQAVSGMIADQTGQWREIPGAEMLRRADPVYDAAGIARQIAYADISNAHWRNLLGQADGDVIEIAYEDLVNDYSATVANLLVQLGSDSPAPPPRMRRQANSQSEQFVLRYLLEAGTRA